MASSATYQALFLAITQDNVTYCTHFARYWYSTKQSWIIIMAWYLRCKTRISNFSKSIKFLKVTITFLKLIHQMCSSGKVLFSIFNFFDCPVILGFSSQGHLIAMTNQIMHSINKQKSNNNTLLYKIKWIMHFTDLPSILAVLRATHFLSPFRLLQRLMTKIYWIRWFPQEEMV